MLALPLQCCYKCTVAWVPAAGTPGPVFHESPREGCTAGEVWGDLHSVEEGWGAHHISRRWTGSYRASNTCWTANTSSFFTHTRTHTHTRMHAHTHTHTLIYSHRFAGKRHCTPSAPSWQLWLETPSWLLPALCTGVHSLLPTVSHC